MSSIEDTMKTLGIHRGRSVGGDIDDTKLLLCFSDNIVFVCVCVCVYVCVCVEMWACQLVCCN